MIVDALGRPLKAGQMVVFDSELVGADKMMTATVVEVSVGSQLDPRTKPHKLLVLIKEFRIPLPIEAQQLPVFIIDEPQEKSKIV